MLLTVGEMETFKETSQEIISKVKLYPFLSSVSDSKLRS